MSVYKDKDKWIARVVGPDGKRRSRTFNQKTDAKRWEGLEKERVQRACMPATIKGGKVTVAQVAAEWLANLEEQGLKPNTVLAYTSVWTRLVEPRWGSVIVTGIIPADIHDWLTRLRGDDGQPLGLSQKKQALGVFRTLLKRAVASRLIEVNPANDDYVMEALTARRTTRVSRKARHLTVEEVERLAAVAGSHGLLIRFLAYTGLRFGEVIALTVGDINERTVTVDKSMSDIKGILVVGNTKSGNDRTVVMPPALTMEMRSCIVGRAADEPLFTTTRGAVIRRANWFKRVWKPAIEAAGLSGLRIHDLRHTYTSLAIASGASVKAVQNSLGHANASTTLNVYAGLLESEKTEVADRLGAVLDGSECQPGASTAVVKPIRKIDL